MLAREIKAVGVNYCPLRLDSRVVFFSVIVAPHPFENALPPRSFIQISMVDETH